MTYFFYEPPVMGSPSSSAAPAGSTPADRATTFQPVEGGPEMRSGGTLLVEAYVVLWIILMVWILLVWLKQNKLSTRLDELEKAIDAADAAQAEKSKQ